MITSDSRGTVRAFSYLTEPMTDAERALLEELRQLAEGDRTLALQMIRHLARLRNPQK